MIFRIISLLNGGDSKTLAYDGVDRLINAGTASVSYDPADNITSLRTSAGTLSYVYANNRLSSVSGWRSATLTYDLYGNVAYNGRNIFAYDDASNLRNVTGPMGTIPAAYDYDGNHQRVRTVKNGKTTYFLYARNGDLLGEYNAVGVWVKEYAYLGGKLVATVENVPTTPGAVAPGIPSSLTVPTASTTGSYTVSWGGSTGTVTRYELQDATDANFTGPIQTYSGLNLSFGVFDKSSGTYYYRVRACNGTACSSYRVASNGITVTTPPSAPPSTPPYINVPSTPNPGSAYTYITWGSSTGVVDFYQVDIAGISSWVPTLQWVLEYSGPALSVPFEDRTQKCGRFYYRVRACNQAGCSANQVSANYITRNCFK